MSPESGSRSSWRPAASGPVCRAMVAAVLMLTALGLNGCSLARWLTNGLKVGPNYVEPTVKTASGWIDFQDPRVKSQEVDLSRWWHVLNDPVLDQLLESAYRENLTLKSAVERISGARARRNVAIGFLFPQSQQAFGGYSINCLSEEAGIPVADEQFSNWELGGALAWEVDIWGRLRRAVEASEAELQASIASYDDVLVILLAEVASNYVLYRTFQERLVFARGNVEAQAGSYQIAQDRLQAGAGTERDVQQAKQVLEQTRSRIPDLEAGLRQVNNALCVLQGMAPTDLGGVLGAGGKIPIAPPEIAVGIPADLVRRRPDVRRAERLAAAQSATIGIAEADFYPRISLTGTLGFQAEQLNRLFVPPLSLTGSVGPSFRWDILNYGRILNNLNAQEAEFRALTLDYQQAVLRAGAEVEDALVAYIKAHERTLYIAESVRAADRTVQITLDQYRQGAVDFTAVFIFQSSLTEQQDLLALARGDIVLALVRLYRALGGGWERRFEPESAETASVGK